ncbi:hypothetical protein L1987_71951 [Smallanthus sonchifolius]|uniref:Uncharacterized protein n=1 Tax=Smallanthus sonchifolius TaxID=185202 RepID=A0ACB9ATG3_9ASTR|nr:hypothetical protein L1987_71951 [Smallanthus sonchifolius]
MRGKQEREDAGNPQGKQEREDAGNPKDVVDGGGVEPDSVLSTVSCIGAFSNVVVDGDGVEACSSCWWLGKDKRLTVK